MTITQVPSPNFFPGRKTWKPVAIVIHIMEGNLSGTDSWFGSKISKVSAHYGVGINGDVHQYVQETDSAWHAGRVFTPSWQLIQPAGNGMYYNPNFYTIGIEHEGDEHTDWSAATYAASSELIRGISTRWNIPLDRNHVIGHHEIYAKKACPGGSVDLLKLISLASSPGVPPATGAPRVPLAPGAPGVPLAPGASSAGGASPATIPPPPPMKILQLGMATTTVRLNVRVSPDRNRAPLTTLDAGSRLAFDGYTEQGEPVSGNSKWFYTANGTWFWSGGVK